MSCLENIHVLSVRRWYHDSEVLTILNFNDEPIQLGEQLPSGNWIKLLDTSDRKWNGNGTAVPDVLEVTAGATLTISRKTAVLFSKEVED